jgi:hypothetical protein
MGRGPRSRGNCTDGNGAITRCIWHRRHDRGRRLFPHQITVALGGELGPAIRLRPVAATSGWVRSKTLASIGIVLLRSAMPATDVGVVMPILALVVTGER